MDNQEIDCGEPQDADDGNKDTCSSLNADDVVADTSLGTHCLASEQQHSSEDRDESMEDDTKVFYQQDEVTNSFGQTDKSPLVQQTMEDREENMEDDTKVFFQQDEVDLANRSNIGQTEKSPLVQFSNSSIVSGSDNKNTHRKTGADLRTLGIYLSSLNETRSPETIPPSELDKYLSSFFLVVKKTDGSEYEPCSLRAMLASIERYLRQKNYPASLTRDQEFTGMRNALKVKQQILRSLGKGQKTAFEIPQSASSLDEKISCLFESRKMGPFSPSSVVFSLCFYVCVYLKLRKSTEHKKLLWGDIILCYDHTNREYLSFSSQMLNNVASQSRRLYQILAKAKVWSEPGIPDRDPVALYKIYAQKRPVTMNQPNAPFYLGYLVNPLPSQSWYRTFPLGTNKLNEMVRQVREMTDLKSASDASPQQHTIPSSSQDLLPTPSELSNAGSDPSSSASREENNVDSCDLSGKQERHVDSLHLITEGEDESYCEPVNFSSAADQPLSLVKGYDSGDDQSVKSSGIGRLEEKFAASPSSSAIAGAVDEGDAFQQQVASMNVAKAREIVAQGYDESDEEEEGDFIGVEQAKELVTDIIRRMDIMDMVHFDQWLKSMIISRDAFSGEIVCKDPQGGQDRTRRNSHFPDRGYAGESTNDTSNMNILLNISLNPTALQGKDPVTVQAAAVSAADLSSLSSLSHLQTGACNGDSHNRHTEWNGTVTDSDSPLDLALNSLHSRSGTSSIHASGVSSSSATYKYPASSSFSGEGSSAKQSKLASDSARYSSLPSQHSSNHTGAAPAVSGRRRKRNPAFLTHIKPRASEADMAEHNGRVFVPSSTGWDENGSEGPYDCVEETNSVSMFNLKQEIE